MTKTPFARRTFRLVLIVAALAVLASGVLQTASAAPSVTEQTCVGGSSVTGGTWTFTAGSPTWVSGQVNKTLCSLGTTTDDGIPPVIGTPGSPAPPPLLSGDTNPIDNATWAVDTVVVAICQLYQNGLVPCGPFLAPESLAASTLTLSGSGNASCVNGFNGTLRSPNLSDEIAAGNQNLLSSEVGYPGVDNTARVVWTAAFTRGIGRLTGTLYGADNAAATPEPVTGVIEVHCNPIGKSGARQITLSVLRMPSLPVG